MNFSQGRSHGVSEGLVSEDFDGIPSARVSLGSSLELVGGLPVCGGF